MHKALFYTKESGNTIRCRLCNHFCHIADDTYGVCHVRKNEHGTLYSYSYGCPDACNVDPIEKKPLYHFIPTSRSFSIGLPGCNFKCDFCQNWTISQIGNRNRPIDRDVDSIMVSPQQIVNQAIAQKCESIAFTYSEPTVFYEYCKDIADCAHDLGIHCIMVSNGYMTVEVLSELKGIISAYNIDLKSFSNTFYKKHCKATLDPVLKTLKTIVDQGIWLEITTLVIPGENDSEEELDALSSFISSINNNIPWHISRFFPQYTLTSLSPTPMETLDKAYAIGKKNGLKYVYIGNAVSEYSDTHCPECDHVCITRNGYQTKNYLKQGGGCPKCDTSIAGVWSD